MHCECSLEHEDPYLASATRSSKKTSVGSQAKKKEHDLGEGNIYTVYIYIFFTNRFAATPRAVKNGELVNPVISWRKNPYLALSKQRMPENPMACPSWTNPK